MVMSPQTLLKEYGEDTIIKGIEDTINERSLDMFGIMCNVMDMKSDQMSRMIFLYSRKDTPFAKTFDGLVTATDKSDLLKCKDMVRKTVGKGEYVYWQLENTSVSRKKYE